MTKRHESVSTNNADKLARQIHVRIDLDLRPERGRAELRPRGMPAGQKVVKVVATVNDFLTVGLSSSNRSKASALLSR